MIKLPLRRHSTQCMFASWFTVNTVTAVCVLSYVTTYHIHSILAMKVWVLALLSISLLVFCSCVLLICRQPQTSKKVSFMVRGHTTPVSGYRVCAAAHKHS